MTMARRAFAVAAAWVALLGAAGVAHADNTNDNSNTNNNSDVGGYLGAGGGEDESKGWPPTKLDWPPSDMSAGGISGSGGDGGDGKSGSDRATPIVMPDGQAVPPKGDDTQGGATSTSTTPTPIVPVGPSQ